ncbi:hypothetical protein BZA77DRAFT_295381 [Pyronema omphalodes]|nr:hypothetical protein BZA77DRAFT_295381 [Pyronema omphalodes]
MKAPAGINLSPALCPDYKPSGKVVLFKPKLKKVPEQKYKVRSQDGKCFKISWTALSFSPLLLEMLDKAERNNINPNDVVLDVEDRDFLNVEAYMLTDIVNAAEYFQIGKLLEVALRTVVQRMHGKSAHQMRYMFQWENDMTLVPEAAQIVFTTEWVDILAGQNPNRKKNELESMREQGYRPEVFQETAVFCSPISTPGGCIWYKHMSPEQRAKVLRRLSSHDIGPALVPHSCFTSLMREFQSSAGLVSYPGNTYPVRKPRSCAELDLDSFKPSAPKIKVTRSFSEPARLSSLDIGPALIPHSGSTSPMLESQSFSESVFDLCKLGAPKIRDTRRFSEPTPVLSHDIGPASASDSGVTYPIPKSQSFPEWVLDSCMSSVPNIWDTRRFSEPAPVKWPVLLESSSDTSSTSGVSISESSFGKYWKYSSPVMTTSKALSESHFGKPMKLDPSVWDPLFLQEIQNRLLDLPLCTGEKPGTSVCSKSQSDSVDGGPIMVSQPMDKPEAPVLLDPRSHSVDGDPSMPSELVLKVLQRFQESQNLINEGCDMIQSDPDLGSIKHLLPEIMDIQKLLSKSLANIGLCYRKNEQGGSFNDSGSDSGFTDTPTTPCAERR